jgi:hypothetical protein
MLGASGGSARLPDGHEIDLGIKDPGTGRVFTPYRIRVTNCLFDKHDACTLGEAEVLIPGGTVYETVGTERRLRTWEVAGGAGAPLPPAGEEVVLFMHQSNGRFLPLNDPGARMRVVEAAEVDRLKSVIARFRKAPTPTSGTGHANPGPFDSRDSRDLGERTPRLRPREDGVGCG